MTQLQSCGPGIEKIEYVDETFIEYDALTASLHRTLPRGIGVSGAQTPAQTWHAPRAPEQLPPFGLAIGIELLRLALS